VLSTALDAWWGLEGWLAVANEQKRPTRRDGEWSAAQGAGAGAGATAEQGGL
jgi:hypothetical protein